MNILPKFFKERNVWKQPPIIRDCVRAFLKCVVKALNMESMVMEAPVKEKADAVVMMVADLVVLLLRTDNKAVSGLNES